MIGSTTIRPQILLVFSIFFMIACKKTSSDALKTKSQLLSSKTWIYSEYFKNYNQANTILTYKRGKANNLTDVSIEELKTNLDGTEAYKSQNGTTTAGTWKFINNETQTEVTNSTGTYITNIIQLDEGNYIWYNSTTGDFAKMIPKQ